MQSEKLRFEPADGALLWWNTSALKEQSVLTEVTAASLTA